MRQIRSVVRKKAYKEFDEEFDDSGQEVNSISNEPSSFILFLQDGYDKLRKMATAKSDPNEIFRAKYRQLVEDRKFYEAARVQQIDRLLGMIDNAYVECSKNFAHHKVKLSGLDGKCDDKTVEDGHIIIDKCFSETGIVPYDATPATKSNNRTDKVTFTGDLFIDYALNELYDSSIAISKKDKRFGVNLRDKNTLFTDSADEVSGFIAKYLSRLGMDDGVRKDNCDSAFWHINIKVDMSRALQNGEHLVVPESPKYTYFVGEKGMSEELFRDMRPLALNIEAIRPKMDLLMQKGVTLEFIAQNSVILNSSLERLDLRTEFIKNKGNIDSFPQKAVFATDEEFCKMMKYNLSEYKSFKLNLSATSDNLKIS